MAYSTDDDLIKIRRDIMDLGVDNWDDQHEAAELLINRDIHSGWFVAAAVERGSVSVFDSDLLDPDQLVRLSSYKTLELAYLYLDHEYESDPFFKNKTTFHDLYEEELLKLFSSGIRYDWNEDGSFTSNETATRSPRILQRI